MCAAPEVTINCQIITECTVTDRQLTSHLEFSSETVIFNPQFTHPIVDHSLDEGLNSKLEVASSEQNVSPDVFMDAGVLLKECLNGFSINPALLIASIIDVSNIVFTQEGSEILGVPNIIALSQ